MFSKPIGIGDEGTKKVYRCFCSIETLERKRKEQLAQGKPPRYDRTCLHLSDDHIKQKLAAGLPFVWRLKLNDDQVFDITRLHFKNALNSENNDIRASAFVLSLVATLKEHDKMYAIKEVRNGNMAILPRTFAIKVVTFEATSYLDKIKTIINKQKNTFVSVVNESKNILNMTN